MNDEEFRAKEEQLFREKYKKQVAMTKRLLLIIFGTLGAVFAVLGALFIAFNIADEEGVLVGWIFMPMGLFWLFLGLIMYFVIPDGDRINYDKFRKRVEKYGGYDTNYLATMVEVERGQIKELQDRVISLEAQVKKLTDEDYLRR